MNNVQVIILAAGEGKRMQSSTAKVLNKVNFKPMIDYVLQAAAGVSAQKPVVVIGHMGDMVHAYLEENVLYAIQKKQLGTGHALMQAKEAVTAKTLLIASGDMPLLTAKALQSVYAFHTENGAAVTVVNSDLYCIEKSVLDALDCTEGDIDTLLQSANGKVCTYTADLQDVLTDCNTRADLAFADQKIRERVNHSLMAQGVTIIDPASTYIEQGVQVGCDTVLYPGTVLEGNTKIGTGCMLYPNCYVKNCTIGNGVEIKSSTLTDSVIGDETTVGPYAYVRPNSEVGSHVKVGDFVELKKAKIGDGTKISHLTYVGDAIVGKNVNFGCGTVTVNYDGKNKFLTEIGDGAFIGCNTNLVAPVKVGDGAFIAAGSTITDGIPEDAFAIARARQVNKENWKKPKER